MNYVRYIEHCPKTIVLGGTRISNLKDGSRPGQPKTVVTNANSSAVTRCQFYSENYCS